MRNDETRMEEQLVVTVDGSRARYFAVGARVAYDGTQRHALTEIETLVNPGFRSKDGELYSDSRPGLRAAFAGGPGHAVDDRRDAHHDEIERKFARLVVERMAALIRERDARYAILAAGPTMLGHLREHRELLPRVEIGELPKHLTELSAHELCVRLDADGLL